MRLTTSTSDTEIQSAVTGKQINDLVGDFELKRKLIHDKLIEEGWAPISGMIDKFRYGLLKSMLILYEQHFFGGDLVEKFTAKGKKIVLQWNTTSTSTAGWCKFEQGYALIEISQPVLLQLFQAGEKHVSCNGLHCSDTLYVAQVVFEHELAHAYISIIDGRSREGHGREFQAFVGNTFGHTAWTHDLFSGDSAKKMDAAEAREQVAAYVRQRVNNTSIVTIRKQSGDEHRCRVISARGTKNIQCEILDERGVPTGSGWFARNPTPYWTVCKIDDVDVPNADRVYVEKKEITISTTMTIEQKTLLVRSKIRQEKRLGVGVNVTYVSKGETKSGIVQSTRGQKNATVKVNSNGSTSDFAVPYSIITHIEGKPI